MQFRRASPEEYDEIFLMGLDVWGDGRSPEIYLDECIKNPGDSSSVNDLEFLRWFSGICRCQ
jgi:hypothetical protein